MMSQTVTLKEVREQLSELVAKAAFGAQKIVITRFGKPAAALISYDEYERLMNPRKRSSSLNEWEKGFQLIDKMGENTNHDPPEQAEAAVNQAVKEVRQSKRASSNA